MKIVKIRQATLFTRMIIFIHYMMFNCILIFNLKIKSFESLIMKYFLFILLVFTITETYPQQDVNPISAGDLLTHIKYFTSPELKGRLSGSNGYDEASNYAAEFFKKIKLKPLQNESYFHYLNVEYNNIKGPVGLSIFNDDEPAELELGKDYVCRGFTGSGDVIADVVFCGYGLSLLEYDDYSGVDVVGKVAMVFKQNPSWKVAELTSEMTYPRYKTNLAAKHGAKAVLFVSKPNDTDPQKLIISVLHGPGEQPVNIPQLHIDIPIADRIMLAAGFNLQYLQSKIDSSNSPFSFNTNRLAHVTVNAEYHKERRTQNIVAILEGSDPKLKNEYILVGAHLDHVGNQTAALYAPGANDNASGAAAVLELARELSINRSALKRSIIFILFASEESGLIGSQFFAENLPVPVDCITAMINLDCIGHGDSIQIGNGKSSPELWRITKNLDESLGKRMVSNTWAGGGADATPFYSIGIPSLYFVTTNSYKYLHLPADRIETLNIQLLKDITNLAYFTINKIAGGEYLREKIKP